jgi:protein-tyrosine phosphatase
VAELKLNADKVGHNLWVGGVPTKPELVAKNFDALVLAAREFQDVFPVHKHPNCQLILAPMDDHPGDPKKPTHEEKIEALRAALKVYDLNKKGKKVLVTCAAGVNRSALIAGLAMILSGKTADEVIAQIRKHRKPLSGSTPLFNEQFCKLLRAVDKAISTKEPQTR